MKPALPPVERHPLEPFLPEGARLLMLGSFPPKRERWSMDFFYPNWINDMWRIVGLLFFDDRRHFENKTEKQFDKERIVEFCSTFGLALFDAASAVRRLQDNASDKFLEVVTQTDIRGLLDRCPTLRAIVTTGEKATDQVVEQFACEKPKVGACVEIQHAGRTLHFWRMPSSSRAYPLSLEKKAEFYRKLFRACEILAEK
ncbi:MAG: uracil-DNA glycosylase family protein [Alistipes sp.]|nr:uracil-DNA glycosylase family protein [Alistipes sp.]